MREGAAWAVLREVWQRGHRCVELQRDGKRTIFVCTRCRTRCYSDGALVDHLEGNLHKRLSAVANLKSDKLNRGSVLSEDGSTIATRGREGDHAEGPTSHCSSLRGDGQIASVASSSVNVGGRWRSPPLEWVGSGELFFSVRSATDSSAPVIDASWLCWKGKGNWEDVQGGGIVSAVVMFPYSDMIGRGGNWKPWFEPSNLTRRHGVLEAEELMCLPLPSSTNSRSSAKSCVSEGGTPGLVPSAGMIEKGLSQSEPEKENLLVGKDWANRAFRVWKRKKAKVVERLCFICHQRMTSGKDVAALLNLQTKQMVCGSRNKRGVFHVYHSSCLIDWIAICEVKTFTGELDNRLEHTSGKLNTKRRGAFGDHQNLPGDGGSLLSNARTEGVVFCPECQGTGLKVHGAQLERPRFRLAQVFDWILELIQARKAWTDSPTVQDMSCSGLLFGNALMGAMQSRGFVQYYSGCAELLSGNFLAR